MLHKRVDYGFGGYQVPFVPRAARSARRRGPIQKKAEDDQLCAFDLLATVAGKILREGESFDKLSPEKDLSNDQDVVMEDYGDQGNPMPEMEHYDHGSPGAASPCLTLELGLTGFDPDLNVKEVSGPSFNTSSAPASAITSSDCLGKDNPLPNIDFNDEKSEFCSHTSNLDGFVPDLMVSCVPPVDAYAGQHDGRGQILFGRPDTHGAEGPEILDREPPAIVSAESVKLTLGHGHYPCDSQSPWRDSNVNLVSRDDDENFSECTQPSTIKTSKSPARIGDRRIRKLLASKHWGIPSKAKDGDLSDNGVRCLYRTRRIGNKRQRSQRIYPFKKRRRFRYSSFSNTGGRAACKSVYTSHDKATNATALFFGSVGHGVNGSSTCSVGQTTFSSKESHVKLRIKSFCVPELFIEMPETATVGSLKRTVMEAVTSLLGGGLRVGVLLQGKRIRDDNRTLSQTGICQEDKMESLGFTLDPNPSNTIPVCSQDNSFSLSTDVPQPVSMCPSAAPVIHRGASHLSPELLETSGGNLIESDHDSAPSAAGLPAEKGVVESHALVAVPEGTPKALSVVSANHKSKRCDMGQRRIRRPFSVAEVESLVQAVEKLGTGRWRDVKLRAFDDAEHRTYVDLKDKWKTLVHTAKIAPQQRRGEPVPQVLLDRVLAAHSYWSQQQAKFKQPSEACPLL